MAVAVMAIHSVFGSSGLLSTLVALLVSHWSLLSASVCLIVCIPGLPLYLPHLNLVEGAVNHSKHMVMSAIFCAVSSDGPISIKYVMYAAEHVCHAHERFMKEPNLVTETMMSQLPPFFV